MRFPKIVTNIDADNYRLVGLCLFKDSYLRYRGFGIELHLFTVQFSVGVYL